MSFDSATREVTLTIDGRSCTVEQGTTILKAAAENGISIPTLCYLKDIAPDGSCRMCVVEVEGGRKGGLPAACTELCANDMVVHTRSPRVIEARRFILDLLLSDHTFECFTCARNGDCRLQDYALEYGLEKTSYINASRSILAAPDTSNPFYDFDPEKCIMCRKCVRMCEKLQCKDTLSASGRSFHTQITTAYDLPRTEPICESCGNCVSVCPTGALASRDQKTHYRSYEVKATRTTCPHCAVGCQFDLLSKGSTLVGVDPADGPSNGGLLCVKGKYGSYKFVNSDDRLTKPLVRKEGVLQEATWDEALSIIANELSRIKRQAGPDAIAGFACSRATNEDNYLFQKMMRAGVGTNNVDNCARV